MSVDEFLDKFQIMRRERIGLVLGILKEKKEVELKSFIGSISVKYGIRPKSLKEYLDDLEAAGKIEIKNGKISPSEAEPEN